MIFPKFYILFLPYLTVLIYLFILKNWDRSISIKFYIIFMGMYTWRNLGLIPLLTKRQSIVNSEIVISWNKIPFQIMFEMLIIYIALHPIFTNVNFVFTFSQTVLATILVCVIASLSMHVTYLHRSKIDFANFKVKTLSIKGNKRALVW